MKEYTWIVYCEWCDKAITKWEDRVVKDDKHFCDNNCLWNYYDENGSE